MIDNFSDFSLFLYISVLVDMSLISSPTKINISDDSIIENETESANQSVVDDIAKNKYEYGASYIQLAKIAQTVDSVLERKTIFRDYRSLKKHSSKRFSSVLYVPCQQCTKYVINGFCSICNIITAKDENKIIVYIPIRQQIKHFLRKYYREIILYLFESNWNMGNIKDIYDSTIWKGTVRDGSIYLSITVNIDGAQCTKSTKKSLWVLQLYQNYLPPNIRYQRENIIVCTIYCGEVKPNLAEFIQFLGDEIEVLRSDRKINAYINDISYIFIPEISLASCDLPAWAPLMGLPLFSGYKACPCRQTAICDWTKMYHSKN